MYSKEEASQIKKKFWTTFGQYMAHNLSSEGLKVNWINYRTGLKDVYFRMDIVKKETYIGIEIHHLDEGIRELFFEQFLELKTYLHSILEEEWVWDSNYTSDHNDKTISRIYTTLSGYTLFNEDHWPNLISFLKSRMVKLDEFWSDARYSFEALK